MTANKNDPLLQAFMKSKNPEKTIFNQSKQIICLHSKKISIHKRKKKKLNILLAGYVGAGNIGSDIRTYEMIRQIHHIFIKDTIHISLMVIAKKFVPDFFNDVNIIHPNYIPTFLNSAIVKQDGIITCEGSLFKSNFSSILSLNMLTALGLASAKKKISIAYGAESGKMDTRIQQFAKKYCHSSLVICRNQASQDQLSKLGMRTTLGSDPAWSFTPSSHFDADAFLKIAGWGNKKKIISICPINPFWWPVRPDPARASKIIDHLDEQYHGSIFFHNQSEAITQKYQCYLHSLAKAINVLRNEQHYFPIIIGMERIDKPACEQLALLLGNSIPTYISGNMHCDLAVHLLRLSHVVLSSRFHALLLAIPGGAIPLGISIDERITNLLTDLGHPELIFQADDLHLTEKILFQLQQVDSALMRNKARLFVKKHLKLIGEMGIALADEIRRFHPEMKTDELPRCWQSYLPSLSPNLTRVIA